MASPLHPASAQPPLCGRRLGPRWHFPCPWAQSYPSRHPEGGPDPFLEATSLKATAGQRWAPSPALRPQAAASGILRLLPTPTPWRRSTGRTYASAPWGLCEQKRPEQEAGSEEGSPQCETCLTETPCPVSAIKPGCGFCGSERRGGRGWQSPAAEETRRGLPSPGVWRRQQAHTRFLVWRRSQRCV